MKQHALKVLLVAVVAVGCAKEKKYEEVYRTETEHSKVSVPCTDPNDPCVYVPSLADAPMNVPEARPHWMGNEKLVTLKFEENALVVYQLVDDERYAANPHNMSPVLRIPVVHKDYRCAEDQFGECSNKEEEINDANWRQKRFFKADYTKIEVLETNFLPLELANVFDSCYTPKATEVKNIKLEDGVFNISLRKTWEAKIECSLIESMADFRNMSFTVDYNYSFAQLSKLAGADYNPVNYPFQDQNTFGFFKTDKKRLSPDGRNMVGSETQLMNRWNPNRSEVVYYLHPDFYLPQMESIRLATEQAVNTINNSLEKAQVKMRLRLADGRGKDLADLRNNWIVLVTDPLASGVIGYGPSVTNPRTGEIVHAKTIMYYGSMTRQVEDTYNDLVAEQQRASARVASGASVPDAGALSMAPELASRAQVPASVQRTLNNNWMRAVNPAGRAALALTSDISSEIFNPTRQVSMSEWIEKGRSEDPFIRAKARRELMSHQCEYSSEMVDWESVLGDSITPEVLGIDELKPWHELSEDDQQKVIAKLMPMIWIPTLVHELGHNLGLRHNFGASEDKDNFYTAQESRALGVTRPATMASVMEYTYSELNVLPVMGKYDIAALRYGYKREVEIGKGDNAGTFVNLGNQTFESLKQASDRVAAAETSRRQASATDVDAAKLAKSLKEFRYCTDEHVEVNFPCQRFDEGTNFKEMAEHHIRAYKKVYKLRNYRNNRAKLSSLDDRTYANRVAFTFESMRRLFELYDRISVKNPQMMNMTDAEWDAILADPQYAQYRDNIIANRKAMGEIKEAATLIADFFIDVLSTPDVFCAAARVGSSQVIGVLNLNEFSADSASCFDPAVQARLNIGLRIVGQIGKFFNHQRHDSELTGDLRANSTELSTRGIWMDKILALRFLLIRNMDNAVFDPEEGNFLDYPLFAGKIKQSIFNFLTDSITRDVDMELADGTIRPITFSYNFASSHTVKLPTVSITPSLQRFYGRMGITKVETDIREVLIPMLKRSLTESRNPTVRGFRTSLDIVEMDYSTTLNSAEEPVYTEFRDADGLRYAKFGATRDMIIGKLLIEQREDRLKLEALGEDLLQEIHANRSRGQIPAEIPEEQRFAYEVDMAFLTALGEGSLPKDEQLIKTFEILSRR